MDHSQAMAADVTFGVEHDSTLTMFTTGEIQMLPYYRFTLLFQISVK